MSDGPESDIDCAETPEAVFSYYFEICHDSRHMWWVNGACNKGVKEEMSELHKCATIDATGSYELGDRKFCHFCDDGEGRYMTLCGADQEKKEDACDLALSDDASDCGDVKALATSYEHSCIATTKSKHLYNRKEFWCEGQTVAYPEPEVFVCGQGWYYGFDNGEEVIFDPMNRYCLDCGPIGVCATDPDATCESLGVREPVPKNEGEYALEINDEPTQESKVPASQETVPQEPAQPTNSASADKVWKKIATLIASVWLASAAA